MSRYEYPEDEFDAADDEGPVPVGVHRAPVPGWRSWVPLLAVLIIVPLLAWGAVQLLGRHGARPAAESTAAAPASGGGAGAPTSEGGAPATEQAPTGQAPTDDAESTATPTNADLTTGVTVHNGTDITGLAGRTGGRLENAGFTSVVVADGVYTEDDPATTTVFYAASENAATAKAVADALGVSNVVESAEVTASDSSPITVVLRDDYYDD